MNPQILSYINLALQIIPILVSAGREVGGLVDTLKIVLNGNAVPTDAQWDQLDQEMSAAMTVLIASAKAPPAA